MKDKGNGGQELLNPNYKRYDLTDPANYEGDYPDGDFGSSVDKILATKSKDANDDADVARFIFIRGNFKNDRQLNAAVRLMHRHRKFGDTIHQELLFCKILGQAAINGVSRLEALFAATNLLGPDMYRTAKGMPRLKKGQREEIVSGGRGDGRGSDFRQDGRPPDGGLGNQG